MSRIQIYANGFPYSGHTQRKAASVVLMHSRRGWFHLAKHAARSAANKGPSGSFLRFCIANQPAPRVRSRYFRLRRTGTRLHPGTLSAFATYDPALHCKQRTLRFVPAILLCHNLTYPACSRVRSAVLHFPIAPSTPGFRFVPAISSITRPFALAVEGPAILGYPGARLQSVFF